MLNICSNRRINLLAVLSHTPSATAIVQGSAKHPEIYGTVKFYQTSCGVVVFWEFFGLGENTQNGVFAFHIHSGGECSGNESDPFSGALTHFNPKQKEHPYHAGDLPPIFSNNGYAIGAVFTNRFSVSQVLGKTVVVHSGVDDFTTQPSGASGEKKACGVIT